MLEYLETAFTESLAGWGCELIEFGGEEDHVHLLISFTPTTRLSDLVNNLKASSAKRCRNRYQEHLAKFYRTPVFWTRAYFAASVGGAPLEVIRKYVETQGSKPRRPA
jgi:putative transposase